MEKKAQDKKNFFIKEKWDLNIDSNQWWMNCVRQEAKNGCEKVKYFKTLINIVANDSSFWSEIKPLSGRIWPGGQILAKYTIAICDGSRYRLISVFSMHSFEYSRQLMCWGDMCHVFASTFLLSGQVR